MKQEHIIYTSQSYPGLAAIFLVVFEFQRGLLKQTVEKCKIFRPVYGHKYQDSPHLLARPTKE